MNNCNYCEGKLELTFQNNNLKVGTCSICKFKQQFSFEHINIDLYETNTNLPIDFKEERIRQNNWNSKRCSLLSEYFGNLENKTALDYGSGTGGFLETYNIYSNKTAYLGTGTKGYGIIKLSGQNGNLGWGRSGKK